MGLNKQKGNMYGFVTHTWNAIKGKCSHGCSYCYMKPFWKSEVHLDEKELKTDLGKNNFLFVGSSTDMFANDVPSEWIKKVFEHCIEYSNTYLFQSKNTKRLYEFWNWFPTGVIIGTTAETNRNTSFSKAPNTHQRLIWLSKINTRRMITIEPILEFDLKQFVQWIKNVEPEFVNIGADSKGHKLPEPSSKEIGHLISELRMFTKVNLKDNLKRIYCNE